MNFDVRVANPVIDNADITNVLKALKEGRLSSGIYAENFEKAFAKFTGAKFAVSVNSATAALQLMLSSKGIGNGDEVITTPYTFAATANVIMLQGAKPIFVDIETDSYNIDTSKIKQKITKKTKAIMPIHFGGQSSDMNEMVEIGKKHDLLVFEDAAPAAGAKYHGKYVGTIGDAGAFSFFPDKNMTTGEGGMLTTNSEEIAEKSKIMRKHGAPSRYYHTQIGWNFKLPDINAALGISQLKKLPKIIAAKNKLARNYTKFFEEEVDDQVTTPTIKNKCTHTFNLYNVRFKNQKTRDAVKQFLEKKKIETRICFPPVHLQPIYVKLLKLRAGSFPVAEECSRTTLCMPMFYGLSESLQHRIVNCVKMALKE